MIDIKVVWLCLIFVYLSNCLPTVYKYNENRVLEPDLVPVSSTVIPLPVYQVGYGINAGTEAKAGVKRPEGPISLLTVHNNHKKKATEIQKPKPSDVSSVKEVSKKEFDHNN